METASIEMGAQEIWGKDSGEEGQEFSLGHVDMYEM